MHWRWRWWRRRRRPVSWTKQPPTSSVFARRDGCGRLSQPSTLWTPPRRRRRSPPTPPSSRLRPARPPCRRRGPPPPHALLLLRRHPPSLFLSNHLVNMYSKCGRLNTARKLFDEMPHRNLVSWTSLLTGYSQHGKHEDCFRLFAAMLPRHLPNEFALGSVLSSSAAAGNPSWGRQVHALACKTALHSVVTVGNALITMYSLCNDDEEEAWRVFLTTPWRNAITWNAMISGFQTRGQLGRALRLFSGMRREGPPCDHCTLVSAAASCSNLHQCRLLQSLATKTGLASRTEVATALLRAYSVAVPRKDLISWTSIIAAFTDHQEAALLLFSRLRREEGFSPDKYTFSAMVKACASSPTDRQVSALHGLITKFGLAGDLVLCNALIHTYARCGSVGPAELVFHQMPTRDVVSWNSIIKAYSLHGRGAAALRAFSAMDVHPDAATFVGLLFACSHSGMVDEGRAIFSAMATEHGVAPQLDHFACMELIGQMPMAPDPVVWSGLLGACRKHGDLRIAERAAQMLVAMAPGRSAGYVLISNMYSEQGSFRDAAPLWKGMKESGVKKVAGLSWIEVGNRVHEFSVGGHRHPQIKAILGELKLIVEKVKEIGYAPETSLVLHDIEEGLKEEQLYCHSEKLALVFGLMNAPDSQSCIKIMKNIRICMDCHRFIKLVSKCVSKKEIVVRDANRFHHFKDGVCTCGDYW
ncbi:unnamed protein product [Spirodela intermedia]|uniref:DYW domain-containing protein n=1 Tax=Spirodela intermedia TaxID=51605 RepID=A0A7I8JSB4_SPIIN|nr:unnamed protein product [Spirodela intermedia]CAA6673070.1 unnamed protein product [Spirodela intermedia]